MINVFKIILTERTIIGNVKTCFSKCISSQKGFPNKFSGEELQFRSQFELPDEIKELSLNMWNYVYHY